MMCFVCAVTLGPKLSETVKGKLSLGARILQAGGLERAFRHAFPAERGERLVKAHQCYLYTTGGPIAGMLFVSTPAGSPSAATAPWPSPPRLATSWPRSPTRWRSRCRRSTG